MDEMAELALKNLALGSLVRVLNDKLREMMSEEEYEEFHKTVPKKAFYDIFDNCPIPHLRDYVLDHFDEIVGDGGDIW